jgi:phosphonate transport system substrate-binding protein
MQRLYFFAVILLLTVSRTTFAAEELKSLTFGILPYIPAVELVEKYKPLVDYLNQELSIPITINVTKNYKQHIQQVGENKFDISFIGGLPYVKVVEEYGKKRLLARYEMLNKPYFRSIIFVSAQSPIQTLKELTGKRFAFGNKNSTLSSLVPHYMLQQVGVKLENLANYDHLSTHEDVILSVLLGSCDAGAVAQEVFHEHQKQYQLRELALSPAISTHILLASDNLSDALFKKIQTALLNLKKQPNAKSILTIINKDMTGFVPVKDSDYDLLRNIVRTVAD